jgi:hypothetical protein
MIQKLGFLRGSIATNDEHVLLPIEGEWLEAIMHMTKSKFLDLLCPKQIQLILIRIHGKFWLSPTFSPVGFQEEIQQFIPQGETNWKCKGLVTPLVIIYSDNV